jgi:hypothetical protein
VTFDTISRRIAASVSRRESLALLAAAVAGSLLGQRGARADGEVSIEACRPDGRRCSFRKRRRKRGGCRRCCTNRGTRDTYFIIDHRGKRRCSCRPNGNRGCVNDSQCCSGICDRGVCVGDSGAACAGATCSSFERCGGGGSCVCASTATGGGLCVDGAVSCETLRRCPNGQSDCPGNATCIVNSCCVDPVCVSRADECGTARRASPEPAARGGRGPTLGVR